MPDNIRRSRRRAVRDPAMLAQAHRKDRHAKPAGADVWTLARQRMAHLYEHYDTVLVAFSGGKDSMCALEAALAAAHENPRWERRHLPLRVVFFDEEVIPYQTEDYVRRVAARPDVRLDWYCLPVKHRNGCSIASPWWWPWDPEAKDRWVRPMPPEALTHLDGFPSQPPRARLAVPGCNGLLVRPEDGNCALVLGIRAAESLVRHYAVTNRVVDNWIVPYITGSWSGGANRGNLWKAYPVYDWSDEDVWTGPRLLGWDYNTAYDLMEAAGISVHYQRIAPGFGETPVTALWQWAQCFPEIWAKMPDRVPGAGSAARYGRTELYSHRGRIAKPAGVTWPEFITWWLERQPDPDIKQFAARRVRMFVRGHYRKTTHPILPSVMHPETGRDWNFILKVAMQADTKERMQPQMRVVLNADGTRPQEAWDRWLRQYRELLAAGVTAAELGHPRSLPDPDTILPGYAR